MTRVHIAHFSIFNCEFNHWLAWCLCASLCVCVHLCVCLYLCASLSLCLCVCAGSARVWIWRGWCGGCTRRRPGERTATPRSPSAPSSRCPVGGGGNCLSVCGSDCDCSTLASVLPVILLSFAHSFTHSFFLPWLADEDVSHITRAIQEDEILKTRLKLKLRRHGGEGEVVDLPSVSSAHTSTAHTSTTGVMML